MHISLNLLTGALLLTTATAQRMAFGRTKVGSLDFIRAWEEGASQCLSNPRAANIFNNRNDYCGHSFIMPWDDNPMFRFTPCNSDGFRLERAVGDRWVDLGRCHSYEKKLRCNGEADVNRIFICEP